MLNAESKAHRAWGMALKEFRSRNYLNSEVGLRNWENRAQSTFSAAADLKSGQFNRKRNPEKANVEGKTLIRTSNDDPSSSVGLRRGQLEDCVKMNSGDGISHMHSPQHSSPFHSD
jgi:hypothetical protein